MRVQRIIKFWQELKEVINMAKCPECGSENATSLGKIAVQNTGIKTKAQWTSGIKYICSKCKKEWIVI